MRTLQQYEVELVSGGNWDTFWISVKTFFSDVLGWGSGGTLDADVRLCTSNGGTANFSSRGGSFTASTGIGATVPVEGMLVPVSVSGHQGWVDRTYNFTCTNASGSRGGNGGNGRISER